MTLPNFYTDWEKYAEYSTKHKRNTISNADFLFDKKVSRKATPWEFVDNPFDYPAFLSKPVEELPKFVSKFSIYSENKSVAIVGAGAAGLCAAYELLRANPNLDIDLFEATDRVGGRLYSKAFPAYPDTIPKAFDLANGNVDVKDDDDDDDDEKKDEIGTNKDEKLKSSITTITFDQDHDPDVKRGPLVEIGAMRFPPTHTLCFHYFDKFDLETDKFPNPHVVHTVMNYGGKSYTWLRSEGKPPGPFRGVTEKFDMIIGQIIGGIRDVWEDPAARKEYWQGIVKKYKNKSFYNALSETGVFTEEEMAIFGALGVGTGGFWGLYRVNFLEILRIAIGDYDDKQEMVVNGSQSLTDNFLRECMKHENFQLRLGTPITHISRSTEDGMIELAKISDKNSDKKTDKKPPTEIIIGNYDAVILTPITHAIQMNMTIEPGIFAPSVDQAIRNVHIMNSTKLAIHPRPEFWGKAKKCGMAPVALTDLAIGQSYCLDYRDRDSKIKKRKSIVINKPDIKDDDDEDLFISSLASNISSDESKDLKLVVKESLKKEDVFRTLSEFNEINPKLADWIVAIVESKLAEIPKEKKKDYKEGTDNYRILVTEAVTIALKWHIQAQDLPSTEGVIFLSYSWGEDSTKFASRELPEAVNLAVDNLKMIYKVYPGLPELFDEYLRPQSTHFGANNIPDGQMEWVNWEREKYTVGAFKLNYSGQQDDVLHLYYQYAGYDPIKHQPYTPSGVFLAGDGVSWAGGWVEGALHIGINAALAVCKYFVPTEDTVDID